jgi:hypothetical protein
MPDRVTNIGNYAFGECTRLTSVTISTNVTSIGQGVFEDCSHITSMTIPAGVTNIGSSAFELCIGLTNLIIGANVNNIGSSAFGYCYGLISVSVPNSVTNISSYAFYQCVKLSSVTIGANVTNICYESFANCTLLSNVYFTGNAPDLGLCILTNDSHVTVYYLPGTTGWESFPGPTPVLWNPSATNDGNFGIHSGKFGFAVTGTTNISCVVECCTNLANPVWSAVTNITLTTGSSYFSDPQWTNHPACFYRFRAP